MWGSVCEDCYPDGMRGEGSRGQWPYKMKCDGSGLCGMQCGAGVQGGPVP